MYRPAAPKAPVPTPMAGIVVPNKTLTSSPKPQTADPSVPSPAFTAWFQSALKNIPSSSGVNGNLLFMRHLNFP